MKEYWIKEASRTEQIHDHGSKQGPNEHKKTFNSYIQFYIKNIVRNAVR